MDRQCEAVLEVGLFFFPYNAQFFFIFLPKILKVARIAESEILFLNSAVEVHYSCRSCNDDDECTFVSSLAIRVFEYLSESNISLIWAGRGSKGTRVYSLWLLYQLEILIHTYDWCRGVNCRDKNINADKLSKQFRLKKVHGEPDIVRPTTNLGLNLLKVNVSLNGKTVECSLLTSTTIRRLKTIIGRLFQVNPGKVSCYKEVVYCRRGGG